jgi:hypothetical protein
MKVMFLLMFYAEWDKTDAQKKREKMLLDELVSIVNKRDELVQHLDSQEKAYVISTIWRGYHVNLALLFFNCSYIIITQSFASYS